MASLNKVTIIGSLGRDPEIRTIQSGNKIANLSVATSESWKDKNSGEWKEKTEWHRVSVMDERLAEVAEKYLKKGSQVYLEGQLQTRSWDKDGVKQYSTEIIVSKFNGKLLSLDKRQASNSGGGGGETPPGPDEDEDQIPF